MEESNVQPVNSPVTVRTIASLYDLLGSADVSAGLLDDYSAKL